MELKDMSLLQLGARLNEINQEIDSLTIEYNQVLDEIKLRAPETSNDENLRCKERVKKLEW